MSFLDAVVETWNEKNTISLSSTLKRAEDNSKLIIEIQTTKYLATIDAWEHASCLDVTVFELSSKKVTVYSAAECETLEIMKARIAQLFEVVASHE